MVPVATAHVGGVVTEIVGATGAVAGFMVIELLVPEIHVWSAVLRAITVYGVPVASPANTPFATHVAPPLILYSSAGSAGVTEIVPVVSPQLGAVVIAMTGATGTLAGLIVIELLAVDIQEWSADLRAVTVYEFPAASPGNTPFATHVIPPSILYSSVGSTGATLMVPVGVPQVGAVVREITGIPGAVPGFMVIELLVVDIHVVFPVIRAITV
jgi:hypothetical protein